MQNTPVKDSTDKSLVTAFILVIFFATPFAGLWARGSHAWYLPYLLWLIIIILLGIAHQYGTRRKGKP
ncbi:hypothetical protein [Thiolapillus sp.]